MRKLIFIISFLQLSIQLAAQDSSLNNTTQKSKDQNTYYNYALLRNFLLLEKTKPGVFSTRIKPQWNSKLYQDQYQQLLAINKKKEFYPELILDSRFVSHAMPTAYGSQNYMWVSTQPKYSSLGEEIASDVISGVVSGFLNPKKKQRFNTNNKKGYYTPAGLKY